MDDYIVKKSRDQRSALFNEIFHNDALMHNIFQENPQDDTTWYKSSDLYNLHFDNTENKERFASRYVWSNNFTQIMSSTSPFLYDVQLRSANNLVRRYLLNHVDLVMRLVPLNLFDKELGQIMRDHRGAILYKGEDELDEIYNEIKISFFLNELIYNYSYVLSLHFAVVLDWFVIDDNSGVHHQAIVSEKLEVTLDDYLKSVRTVDQLRVILFQIFNALEIAWLTHRLVHNDLHTGNIMLCVLDDTPLRDKNLLYRRYADNKHWYQLDAHHVKNRLIKIIDMGRACIQAPSLMDQDNKHDHSRRIGPCNFPQLGISPHFPVNPYNDTRTIFTSLLRHPFWNQLRREELIELEAVMNTALSVERLNVFSVFDLIGHDDLLNDMNQATNYTRRLDQFGLLASEILDSSFFASLKHKSSLMTDVDKLNAVVSFPVSINELAPTKLSCHVCKDKVATHKTVDKYFCGNICYEFYYLFKSKTVYR
jgi:hypothetical protein